MNKGTILLIDDERAIREMLKPLLEIEGYRVEIAADGLEGIDLIRKGIRPSVILLDMMMPRANGWDFLDVLRTHPDLGDIPVVAVSAYKEVAKSVRPTALVTKPIQLQDLLLTLEKVVA
jgi:two-component system response regulator MprA